MGVLTEDVSQHQIAAEKESWILRGGDGYTFCVFFSCPLRRPW